MIDLISPTLRNIEAYCECSGMHCNDEKVEAMMNRLQPSSFPPIRYAGQETRVLDTLRHLGVILDVQLNFSACQLCPPSWYQGSQYPEGCRW